MVFVISKTGKKLMPTTERRCRKLLARKRARIVSHSPFAIQLSDNDKEYTQSVTFSEDMGSSYIGYAAIVHGEKKEKVVCKGEVEQRAYVNAESKTPVLQARASYRRGRRSRLWYRKPRFDNRKRGESGCKACGKNTPTGQAMCRPCAKQGHANFKGVHKKHIWLSPTVKAKADLHLRIIRVYAKYLPIDNVVIETVSFDMQKLNNPDISGSEYQQGEQAGFENVKMFVRFRDRYTCRMCRKDSKKLEIHHIVPRKKKGTDRPANLITLCRKCHKKVTGKEEDYRDVLRKAIGASGKSLAKTAQVNSFKEYILANMDLPHQETFGYITKLRREKLGLEKSHVNDAIVAAVKYLDKPLVDKCDIVCCKSQRRAVRQQYKANPRKGKGFVRYRQPFNQIGKIGRGDICLHEKKHCRVIIDTLLTTGKFNARNIKTDKRIGSIAPRYLKLLRKKKSLMF